MESTISKNYSAVDCMKLVMAIIVVGAHTTMFSCLHSELIDYIFEVIKSFAVPYFFIASGYFLYNKIVDSPIEYRLIRIKKWWKRIAKLYIIWTVIYLPFSFYGFYLGNTNVFKSFLIFIRNVLLVGQNLWSWQLWYLHALLVTGVLIYILEKKKCSYLQMILLAFILANIGNLLDYLHLNESFVGWWTPLVDFYYKVFFYTRNGLFKGLLYVLLGVGIAVYRPNINRIFGIAILVMYCMCYQCEWIRYIACSSLFLLTISYELHGNLSMYRNMRFISTIVYLSHMIFVGLFLFLFGGKINSMILFLIVLCCALITSLLVIKKKNSKLVCFLFS